jgi:hypothetical protein
LFQQFTLGASKDTLLFDWNFLTDEFTPDQQYNDFAFAQLFSGSSLVASAYVDTFATFSSGGPDFASETGWQSVSFGGLTPSTNYTLVFGVFDADTVDGTDTAVISALLIDNIRAVPEPSSAALLGLCGLGLLARRRR